MRILCDMGVSMKVVDWLRDQGHDCIHLRDEGLHRLRNGEIFGKAIAENRIVLTFDLDFGELSAAAKVRGAGVIVFRLRNARANHVIERLAVALEQTIEPLIRGAIVVIEESRLRIREWPINEAE